MGPEQVVIQMFRDEAIIRAYWREVVMFEDAEMLDTEFLEGVA
jgi:hypothetical protein